VRWVRDLACSCVGWSVWVHEGTLLLYVVSRLILLDLRYHLMFVEIICTCTLNL